MNVKPKRKPNKKKHRELPEYKKKVDQHSTYFPKVKRRNLNLPRDFQFFKMIGDEELKYAYEKELRKQKEPLAEPLRMGFTFNSEASFEFLLENLDVMDDNEKIEIFKNCTTILTDKPVKDILSIINDRLISEYMFANIYHLFSSPDVTKIFNITDRSDYSFKDLRDEFIKSNIRTNDIERLVGYGINRVYAIGILEAYYTGSNYNDQCDRVLSYIGRYEDLMKSTKLIISLLFNRLGPIFEIIMIRVGNHEIYNQVLDLMESNLSSDQIERVIRHFNQVALTLERGPVRTLDEIKHPKIRHIIDTRIKGY